MSRHHAWVWPLAAGVLALACATETAPPAIRPSNPTCHPPPRPIPEGREGLPGRLGETGCFERDDPTRPLPALIPYAINAPLWSDGAEKERWLALPDGATIRVRPDGDWELPPGSVLVKTFRFDGRRVETRFFVRHPAGEWSGYTYEWNEAGTDALLLSEGSHRKRVGEVEWHYPTRRECTKCHTAAAGDSLGLETAQLDRLIDRPGGRRANQLVLFAEMGLLDSALPDAGARSVLPDPTDPQAPLEARARAYLHANCANCHRPEVDGSGSVDLRFATPLAATMSCDAEPLKGSLGYGPEMRIIAPGKPDLSMLIRRMQLLESGRMPTLASLVVDQAGVALLSSWIASLARCP